MKCKKILSVIFIMVLGIFGCESKDNNEELYRSIYEKTDKSTKMDSLEVKQEIINYFEEKGYAAVDVENQIDMVHPEQIEAFCRKAEDKKKAESTLFSIVDGETFIRYDMQTKNGEIDVIVNSVKWEDQNPKIKYSKEFQANTWKYTDNGYFFIEEYHMPGYDGSPGQIGFRVKPLDQTCRELNRKYVMPVGYERNKLLITDWNEQDYTNLDFYDLYEIMYRMKYGEDVPYESDYHGAEHDVPKDEFEGVLKSYLQIDSDVIKQNTVYNESSQTYCYRPRGLYDCEFPYGPYPEVTDYEERNDGTIKLTVNAVWIMEEQDSAITSELVVRPLENGRFQYVSNHVISPTNGIGPKWYKERLSDSEWDEHYREE